MALLPRRIGAPVEHARGFLLRPFRGPLEASIVWAFHRLYYSYGSRTLVQHLLAGDTDTEVPTRPVDLPGDSPRVAPGRDRGDRDCEWRQRPLHGLGLRPARHRRHRVDRHRGTSATESSTRDLRDRLVDCPGDRRTSQGVRRRALPGARNPRLGSLPRPRAQTSCASYTHRLSRAAATSSSRTRTSTAIQSLTNFGPGPDGSDRRVPRHDPTISRSTRSREKFLFTFKPTRLPAQAMSEPSSSAF